MDQDDSREGDQVYLVPHFPVLSHLVNPVLQKLLAYLGVTEIDILNIFLI